MAITDLQQNILEQKRKTAIGTPPRSCLFLNYKQINWNFVFITLSVYVMSAKEMSHVGELVTNDTHMSLFFVLHCFVIVRLFCVLVSSNVLLLLLYLMCVYNNTNKVQLKKNETV